MDSKSSLSYERGDRSQRRSHVHTLTNVIRRKESTDKQKRPNRKYSDLTNPSPPSLCDLSITDKDENENILSFEQLRYNDENNEDDEIHPIHLPSATGIELMLRKTSLFDTQILCNVPSGADCIHSWFSFLESLFSSRTENEDMIPFPLDNPTPLRKSREKSLTRVRTSSGVSIRRMASSMFRKSEYVNLETQNNLTDEIYERDKLILSSYPILTSLIEEKENILKMLKKEKEVPIESKIKKSFSDDEIIFSLNNSIKESKSKIYSPPSIHNDKIFPISVENKKLIPKYSSHSPSLDLSSISQSRDSIMISQIPSGDEEKKMKKSPVLPFLRLPVGHIPVSPRGVLGSLSFRKTSRTPPMSVTSEQKKKKILSDETDFAIPSSVGVLSLWVSFRSAKDKIVDEIKLKREHLKDKRKINKKRRWMISSNEDLNEMDRHIENFEKSQVVPSSESGPRMRCHKMLLVLLPAFGSLLILFAPLSTKYSVQELLNLKHVIKVRVGSVGKEGFGSSEILSAVEQGGTVMPRLIMERLKRNPHLYLKKRGRLKIYSKRIIEKCICTCGSNDIENIKNVKIKKEESIGEKLIRESNSESENKNMIINLNLEKETPKKKTTLRSFTSLKSLSSRSLMRNTDLSSDGHLFIDDSFLNMLRDESDSSSYLDDTGSIPYGEFRLISLFFDNNKNPLVFITTGGKQSAEVLQLVSLCYFYLQRRIVPLEVSSYFYNRINK